jgi:hypothetical protein
MKQFLFLVAALLCPLLANAQLTVTVLSPKVTGQKAVVPLALKNGLAEKVESARAAVFLLDEQGKMVAHGTRWVIGAGPDQSGLAPGATNAFNFVIATDKPFPTTNLTAKLTFSRVVLEAGKSADITKDVRVEQASK